MGTIFVSYPYPNRRIPHGLAGIGSPLTSLLPTLSHLVFELRKARTFPLRVLAPSLSDQIQSTATDTETDKQTRTWSRRRREGELTGRRTRPLELMIALGAGQLHEIQWRPPTASVRAPAAPRLLLPSPHRSSATRRARGGGDGGGEERPF
jgi:hypothetical protein